MKRLLWVLSLVGIAGYFIFSLGEVRAADISSEPVQLVEEENKINPLYAQQTKTYKLIIKVNDVKVADHWLKVTAQWKKNSAGEPQVRVTSASRGMSVYKTNFYWIWESKNVSATDWSPPHGYFTKHTQGALFNREGADYRYLILCNAESDRWMDIYCEWSRRRL